MSERPPPNPNVSDFNNLYWLYYSNTLNIGQLDQRYLKWPVSQGSETINGSLDVLGLADLTTATISSPPVAGDSSSLVPTTAWVQNEISGGGGGGSIEVVTISSAAGIGLISYTMPANAYKYDIELWGYGGIGSGYVDNGVNTWSGGAGGSGVLVKAFGLDTAGGTVYQHEFPVNVGAPDDAYWYLASGPTQLIKAVGGADGTAAVIGTPGVGGEASSTVEINNTYLPNAQIWVGLDGEDGSIGPTGSPVNGTGGYQNGTENQSPGEFSVGQPSLGGLATTSGIVLTIYKT